MKGVVSQARLQLAITEMEKHSRGHVVSVTSSTADAAISGVYSVLAA
ncbi:ferric-dicitrate binding protein FerR (iron transport regulator) [Paraburkholderia sp. WC7.3d]